MLKLTAEGRNLIHSDALILETLFDIEYGNKDHLSDGSVLIKDVNGNIVDPYRITSASVDIAWSNSIYKSVAVDFKNVTQDADGKISEASLGVGNVDREIQKIISLYDLTSKGVWITKLLIDPVSCTVLDNIQMKLSIKTVSIKEDFALFTLSVGVDVLALNFPSTTIRANICRWKFKGEDCQYSGTVTTCKKTWGDCLAKKNSRCFGGFPGVINEKFYI